MRTSIVSVLWRRLGSDLVWLWWVGVRRVRRVPVVEEEGVRRGEE